ncbi:hypothetical protein ISF_00850 [Cordyceps fumosorosea ARSEF 2679]|uniref:Uncharacterized protein n=1 Tax=Cordyceps fumosorosea (strain ARSEF 2679) TaxID=1081104 RepID=A0A162N1F0_CORFA|nr:hypothetical protein ISF_00850 [Cordyceps fumosorosea ARSEF 2679]OAA73949.1 hypothetical protein ISF_00850 [Cordyceps fumosorosea ARSEF 2679]
MAIIPITTSELAITTPVPPTPPASTFEPLHIHIPISSISPAASQPSPPQIIQPPSTPTMASSGAPFVSQSPQHPLPAWARNFPEPTSPVDIEKALNSKPPRWTFQVALKANLKREAIAEKEARPRILTEAQVKAELAMAKELLRDIAKRMNAKRTNAKRMNVKKLDRRCT